MRFVKLVAAASLTLGAASVAEAQILQQQAEERRMKKEAEEAAKRSGNTAAGCTNADQSKENECIKAADAAAQKSSNGQKGIIAALDAGNAKTQAQDFDGAITDYQAGVAGAPAGHPNLYELHNALANAYRARAAKTFNAAVGPGVTQLPPAVLTSVGSDLKASLEQSNEAATIAGTDQAKLTKVSASMRESAKLWAGADRAGVEAAARPTLDTELKLFNEWAPTATPQQLTQYAPGLGFALLPKDKDAAIKLGEDTLAKQPSDIDTIVFYVQLVAEAKLPPADPRRVKAKGLAESTLANGTLTSNQKVKLANARIKLTSAT